MSNSPERDREIYWRTKLRRLRFGSEPLAQQVAKYRRATIALSVVAGVVALMFLGIFTAFRRPDIALLMIAVVFCPILLISWRDLKKLERDYTAYEAEKTAQGAGGLNANGSS
jgi:hypothetical protein